METKCRESPANAPLVPGVWGEAGIYIDRCIIPVHISLSLFQTEIQTSTYPGKQKRPPFSKSKVLQKEDQKEYLEKTSELYQKERPSIHE